MVAPSAASATKFLSAPPAAIRGFLLYGNDAAQISARAESLVTTLAKRIGKDAEILKLHDSDLTGDADRIIVELTTGSLFGGTKILRVTSAPAKAQSAILEAIAKPLDNAYLVVEAPDLKKSHKIVQAFEAAPQLAVIASYGEDRESLAASIREHVRSFGYQIGDEAAALIATRCDFSATLARGEAEKLMTFAGETMRISLEDVEACLIDQQTSGLSEIVDPALMGDARTAILAFERFMAVEQNITPVLVVLSSALLRLHAVRTAVDSGTSVMQAIKELRPPIFFKQQDILASQARRWTVLALEAQLGRLNDTLRNTRLKPELAEHFTTDFILSVAKEGKSQSGSERSPR